MPLYENTLIARQDISSQQVDGLSEQFQEIVHDNGGKVAKTEYWGLRSLTYKIKKNRKGHYLHMQIDAPAEAIQEMERNMRISEDVMRYLTIKVQSLNPEPSVAMAGKSSKEPKDKIDTEGAEEVEKITQANTTEAKSTETLSEDGVDDTDVTRDTESN